MKKKLGLFAVLIMLFSFISCVGQGVRQAEQPEQVVEEFNRCLPTRADPVTTLEKITRNGSVLTYHYVVDLEASEIPKEEWQRTVNERTESACDNGNRKYFTVMFKVFDCIYYDFRDKDGDILAFTRLDKKTCN
jgi:hypothetical protein